MEYNMDEKLRNEMLNVSYWYGDIEKYDIASFEKCTAETLETLIQLGFADPDETQNDAPSIGNILEFMKSNPSFTAHGYVVTADRSDYRMSIEGVKGNATEKSEIMNFVDMFRRADDFVVNDGYQYAWYD